MTLWEKGGGTDPGVLRFSAGEEYLLDSRLVPHDCRASIAHARMLGSIGVLTAAEVDALTAGLERIVDLHAAGEFVIAPEQEDCHTAIEEWLTAEIGEAGEKIHLGRSRNDQVLTALRLWQKEALAETDRALEAFRQVLQARAGDLESVPMPGYTHWQRAMPTIAGTWLGAFAAAGGEEREALARTGELIDASPLGTGAGFGVPVFDLDREMTARELGFARIEENPIHAQLTRGKHEAAILAVLSQISFTLNRLACDLLLFTTREFGFVTLPEELCTGSSMMPQKRNPDVLELIRARYSTVLAREFEVRSLIGNLISGYQRDLGLTKAPLFSAYDTTLGSLKMMRLVVEGMVVNAEACRAALTPEVYATEEANRLVAEGLSFREAYRRVADRIRAAAETGEDPDTTGSAPGPDRNGSP